MTAHIALLGDSIFDNASYVPGELCVTEQLSDLVPTDVAVTMLAVDGDCVRHVKDQIKKLPSDTTHLFVSVGGNDALGHYGTLFGGHHNAEVLFTAWSQIQNDFRTQYRDMLASVVALERHTSVCTIYDAVPGMEAFALSALSLFNDVIISEAAAMELPIVDLRQVCVEPTDYSALSPIEPSASGGAKIARALHEVFARHDFEFGRPVIYSI